MFQLHKQFYNNIRDICEPLEFTLQGRKGYISNFPASFDIEASSFYVDGRKCVCMYAWVLGINGKCIRGRFWWEFLDAIKYIVKYYGLGKKRKVVIYIHNLSYEFQFFRKLFKWRKVFSVDSRKPLYAITEDGIEFRCSYLLSGYNLATLGNNLLKYKVPKKVGDLDYELVRHSFTKLTDQEWGYILNDGLIVMAYIQEEIERVGSIGKLPLTKTGYVRNLCREKCLGGEGRRDYRELMGICTLTTDDYLQLKRTYSGGFTHANIHYINDIMYNVSSYDFTSAYPTVMVSEKFPIGSPTQRNIREDDGEFRHLLNTRCCMFDAEFVNISSISNYENYISKSRCLHIENEVVNNGRIVEADVLTVPCTELDFKIIDKMYEWDEVHIYNFKWWNKEYLPKDLILTVLELYKSKTELKGVRGNEAEYLVSKGMLNSTYGMCVTDICKDEQIYDGQWAIKKADLPTLIDKYNKDKRRFLYYAWGVWVTAYARYNLFSGIMEFGDDYIYSDTDSIKVINAKNHSEYFKKYNREITEKISACLSFYNIPLEMSCPKTIKGVQKPLGVWDYEGVYTRFKTLGAKRYMIEKKGEIEITIAGVAKKAGVEYLKHTYVDNDNIFNAFQEEMTFPAHYDKDGIDSNGSGKLCHTYIDCPIEDEVIDYLGGKGYAYEQSAIHMENTEYTLGLDAGFKKLFLGIKECHIV